MDPLKNHGGGIDPFTKRLHSDHLLSVSLLLASAVVSASFGAAIRSLVKKHTRPLLNNSEQDELDGEKSDDKSKSEIRVFNGAPRSNMSQPQSVNSDNVDFTKQEPTILSIKGLRNRGQTCYANSVLQALASLSPFCKYLQQLQQNGTILGHELYQTIQYINGHEIGIQHKRNLIHSLFSFSSSSPIKHGDPYKVLNYVAQQHSQFRSRNNLFAGTSEQQDAHEFFTALMDVLSTEEGSGGVGEMVMGSCNTVSWEDDRESISLLNRQRTDNDLKHKSEDDNNLNYEDDVNIDQEEKKHDDQTAINNQEQQSTSDKAPKPTSPPSSIGLSQRDNSFATCPFDGWSGSTIKCNSCHHIRPIRTAPFVALSLPIANGTPSSKLQDLIALEYGGFKTAERVSDVLCLSCAIRKQLEEIEGEEVMLAGAISSIRRRKGGSDLKEKTIGNEIHGLVKMTQQLKARAAWLKSVDPDVDEDLSNTNNSTMDEFELIGYSDNSPQSPKLKPIRGDAWKASLIMRPPKVLCLHIQRRHFDYRSGQMVKIRHHVDFPEVMDMSDFYAFDQHKPHRNTRTKFLYKLMSVIEHQGGAFGGHYQTYRRSNWNDGSSKWVLVSDESVNSRSWNEVQKCQAYMLFYAAIN